MLSKASEDAIRDEIAQLEEEICELTSKPSNTSRESEEQKTNNVTTVYPRASSEHCRLVEAEVTHATE